MITKELLQENRSRGWTAVSETAPAWVRSQIIAFRAAALDGREFRMSPRMIREAETRSLAQRSVRIAKTAVPVYDAMEALKRKAHGQYQRIAADFRQAGLPVNASERAEASARCKDAVLEMAAEIKAIAAAEGAL